MDREDLGEGRERQDAEPPGGEAADDDAGGAPSPELVATTVEALRARIDEDGREALRGTIAPPAARPPGEPDRGSR